MAGKKWMQKAFAKNSGALHRELGVAPGRTIPVSKLAAAASRAKATGNTKLSRRVNLAKTGARIARQNAGG